MDFQLRCNTLKCRKPLQDQAIVTTCSHIFCVRCVEAFGLSKVAGASRTCPACESVLSNPDDVALTQLNPTEEFKTSILSGLSPTVILECASKGLAFWTYQATQEIVYQEYLAKSLTEKYTHLSNQMDKLIHDANSEISNIQNKFSALTLEQDELQRKHHEVIEAFREKSRKCIQLQELYDKLKRRTLLSHVQTAAFNSADDTLLAASENGFPHRSEVDEAKLRFQAPNNSNTYSRYSPSAGEAMSKLNQLHDNQKGQFDGNQGIRIPSLPKQQNRTREANQQPGIRERVFPSNIRQSTLTPRPEGPRPAASYNGNFPETYNGRRGIGMSPSGRRPVATANATTFNAPARSIYGQVGGISQFERTKNPGGIHSW